MGGGYTITPVTPRHTSPAFPPSSYKYRLEFHLDFIFPLFPSKIPMIPQEHIGASPASLDRFASHGNVTYSCGHCGYALNLCSSHRNTTNIGSKYGKTISRGVLSFYSIDDSRFSRMDESRCLPYFRAKNSWGILRRRTKLLCGKCRTCIGTAYDMASSPVASGSTSDSGSSNGFGKKYNIRISALQPSSFDESGIPLFT